VEKNQVQIILANILKIRMKTVITWKKKKLPLISIRSVALANKIKCNSIFMHQVTLTHGQKMIVKHLSKHL
jgi:hypothetical protein